MGLLLVVAGVCIALAGLLLWSGGLSWFGRLPGDLRIERGATRLYAPITSMLIASVVLSVLLSAIFYFLRRP
jgi:hypothetical protein